MSKPPKIRMCISCRKRDRQERLYRFQCLDKQLPTGKLLIRFTGRGRSFYICADCISSKTTIKKLSKMCSISKEKIPQILEEIL